jgi:hypothetical protein
MVNHRQFTQALKRSRDKLFASKSVGILEAAFMHTDAACVLNELPDTGPVREVVRLIRAGKTQLALQAVQSLLIQAEKEEL